MLKHLCNDVFNKKLQIRILNNWSLLYEKSSSRCVKLSFLGGTDRGVEWDFHPVILLHLVCNLAGLWSDCIERVRLCVLGRSLFPSQCILPAVKLHRPRSRSHRSMTRNSVVGLVMQWPRHTYIRAGFHCVWISWGENLTTWRFVEWAVKIWQSQAETCLYHVQECWRVFVCRFYRGPDTARLPHHRHGAPAEGCGKNAHGYNAVCSQRKPRSRDLLVQRFPACGY